MQNDLKSLLRTLELGFVAGLAGAWAMSQFTRMWNIVLLEHAAHLPRRRRPPFTQQEWDATRAMADAVACQISGRRLSDSEKQAGAFFCHYAVGGAAAALYAAVASRSPVITKFSGMVFGASVWLIAEELLMPAAQCSEPPPTPFPQVLAPSARGSVPPVAKPRDLGFRGIYSY